MKKAGAKTIAQDEKTCVVFGMPKEAIKKGGAEVIIPLQKVAQTLIQFAQS
jgi:two-component system chemotaxis response regulator CheB